MVESNEIGAKAVYKFNGTGIKLFSQTGYDKGIAKGTTISIDAFEVINK